MYLLKEIIKVLEEIAPPKLAESWDNVGLIIGSKKQEVHNILCALDINQDVISEAVKNDIQCIVTHHPFIFKPINKINFDNQQGEMIRKLIFHNISVYAMHTNYDIVRGGTNDILCDKLNIYNTEILHISQREALYKVAVYVPEMYFEQVRNIIIKHDICDIGSYKGCTFTMAGEGTFIPVEGSKPYLGELGQLEKVYERKIEFIAHQHNVESIQQLIREQHPYEEVAFDIYTLNNNSRLNGVGRYGELEQEMTLEAFIAKLKKTFNLSYIRMTVPVNTMIKKVAVCSGSGAEYIKEASKVADAYVTGDIKFHDAQRARDLGINVFDIGHYTSENIAMQYIASCLNSKLEGLYAMISEVDSEVINIK
ncbi:Nif3-like dinuclear metal center hexameric protein [Cellulosilyticum sp. I15G10I2]|uniref:Nif3-like dinuclear metal center hexameric protein n=1 Tax=Cellulosilyticum sp. I15G10I2 TaxID=1892843 RepID=UPI00085BEFAB|nr:Nif3-like dinuclear metal center hexameric protein [Cellulosilyticum sp. I15G10I2]